MHKALSRRGSFIRSLGGYYVLYALTQADHAAAADLLMHYGSSEATVNEKLERAL